MKFIDECTLIIQAGDGGNGAVAFRREKYVPHGGPSGGDGGRGGSVYFVGDEGMSTLYDLVHQHTVRAERGEHGQGKDCYGHAGEDFELRVPVGTQIRDADSGELVADVTDAGQRALVAKGGRGGRGNIHFKTAQDRAPRRAELGEPGQTRKVRLELKVLADGGIIGFPNVGKSTFIRAVSRARPEVADYPFTTLIPHLGVVTLPGTAPGTGTTFVLADIPGLIPGASQGAGLGIQFLKHVERTRVLLHLVTLDPSEGREPLRDYDVLRAELAAFDPELAARPEIVALSKADLPEVRDAYADLARKFAKKKVKLRLFSAATHEGLDAILREIFAAVRGVAKRAEAPLDSPAAETAPESAAAKAAPKSPTAKGAPEPPRKVRLTTKRTSNRKPKSTPKRPGGKVEPARPSRAGAKGKRAAPGSRKAKAAKLPSRSRRGKR